MWTSTADSLPEPGVDVLVLTEGRSVIARLVEEGDERYWESDGDDAFGLLPPTHWHPLPPPPSV